MIHSRQLCTFFLDGFLYGLDVTRVQEVLRYQEMTDVPLAPSHVRGLINLRGQIVTAVDMRARLELPRRAEGTLPMNVIVRGDDGGQSLLVDEIGDVVEVSDDTYEAPPDTVPTTSRSLLRGVFKLQNKLLLELDADKLLAAGAAAEAA
ncbi:MAG: chemotaxis protein CheW [Myxococcales bacterium]|jgi:purine-binding chemotaxis protein CheW|nr:chemotaxis protein CheW [Myxococcales bacterium]